MTFQFASATFRLEGVNFPDGKAVFHMESPNFPAAGANFQTKIGSGFSKEGADRAIKICGVDIEQYGRRCRLCRQSLSCLKEFLSKPITPADIVEARELCAPHFGSRDLFNEAGFETILRRHDGYWPVSIRAVPGGSVVPVLNALITVENTDPELPWVTNFLETLMVQVWYPITVATLSWQMKRIILAAMERSGDPGLIDFKLYDFGCRGVSSMESAKIGGLAHLVNFKGTDTVPALAASREYYGSSIAGFSIPAAEHSTVTSWGEHAERQAFENMLEHFPSGLVAVVSDSWNIYDACRNIWGGTLKDRVMGRDGTVVIRPDSGTPHQIVVEVLDILGEKFGSTMNAKGFKVLVTRTSASFRAMASTTMKHNGF